jgi:hypothetical protein
MAAPLRVESDPRLYVLRYQRSHFSANIVQAQVIKNIAVILEEAGTSWDYVLKTTVYLADMGDYAAMNEVYGSMLPSPKPGRTAVQVGKLPGDFLIEIEASESSILSSYCSVAIPDK